MERAKMRRYMRDYRGLTSEITYKLPDGRKLVSDIDGSAKVIDGGGNEMVPSPAELAALLVVAEMGVPGRGVDGTRLFRVQREEWKLAGYSSL